MGVQTFDQRYIFSFQRVLDAGAGTGRTDFAPYPPAGCYILGLLASNSDAIDHVANLFVVAGGTPMLIGSALIPTRQGYDGSKAFDFLAACLPTNYVLPPLDGETCLGVSVDVAVTGSEVVNMMSFIGQL